MNDAPLINEYYCHYHIQAWITPTGRTWCEVRDVGQSASGRLVYHGDDIGHAYDVIDLDYFLCRTTWHAASDGRIAS